MRGLRLPETTAKHTFCREPAILNSEYNHCTGTVIAAVINAAKVNAAGVFVSDCRTDVVCCCYRGRGCAAAWVTAVAKAK